MARSASRCCSSTTPSPDDTSPDGTTPATGSTPAGDRRADRGRRQRRRASASTVHDAADVSDGATWLGRVLSTLGLAILFGSFVLIVVAWPEGPEYILAVRFLRSVWILTFAGTLLYVIALSAAVNDESLGNGLSPGTWLDLLDAGWPGRAAIARLVLVIATGWVVLRPERVIDPTTQLPALAIPTLAVVTIGLARTGGDLAALGVLAGHRPRPGDGDLVRRRRAARPRRAGRTGRGGPRAGRPRVRPHLRPGDRAHRRQRPRPALPPRRRLAVQRRRTAGCSSSRRCSSRSCCSSG